MRPLAALVALTTLLLASTTCGAPVGNVTKIADGFAWLENLWFDTKGGLYASDFYKGTLWKWTRDPVTGTINQTKWLAPGWIEIFGISESPFPDTILVVAVYNLTSSGIEVVSTEEPNVHYQLARTPRAGNGLAFNPANGWVYTPNEGFFIPTLSETMAFNVAKRNQSSTDGIIDASIFQSGMTAADGTWVDVEDQLLYLTDSIQGRVMVYNVSNIAEAAFGNKSFLYSYSAPGCTTVDDLCVSHDLPRGVRPPGHRTPYVFIADFLGGALRSFDATGAGAAQTWATGFHSLTSARQGRGNGWDSDCIFVTEGGTLDPFETNRGLWQVRLTKTLE